MNAFQRVRSRVPHLLLAALYPYACIHVAARPACWSDLPLLTPHRSGTGAARGTWSVELQERAEISGIPAGA